MDNFEVRKIKTHDPDNVIIYQEYGLWKYTRLSEAGVITVITEGDEPWIVTDWKASREEVEEYIQKK